MAAAQCRSVQSERIPAEAWGGFTMQTDAGKGEAVFTREDADGLQITKRFIVPQVETRTGFTPSEWNSRSGTPVTRT